MCDGNDENEEDDEGDIEGPKNKAGYTGQDGAPGVTNS